MPGGASGRRPGSKSPKVNGFPVPGMKGASGSKRSGFPASTVQRSPP